MDRQQALAILGLDGSADHDAIRLAHRRRIREVHPDAGGSARDAALVNAALAALRGAPDTEEPAAPASTPGPTEGSTGEPAPVDVDHYFVVDERPTALLTRLAEAGHQVGEVVFVDPHGGLLEIIVGKAPGVGQLAVSVGPEGPTGTPVSFTLDPLGVTPAPPIAEVVGALMAALRG